MKALLTSFCLILLCSTCTDQPKEAEVNSPDAAGEGMARPDGDPADYIGRDFLIDDQHSYIGFKIKYFGYSPVRGRFNDFDGTLFYREDRPEAMMVSVIIDAGTINTGNARRDDDLTKDGSWFDVPQFPTISFHSTEVQSAADGSFALIGELTIKGVTKIDTIAFDPPTSLSKDWAANDQVDFSGRTTINRQDFGVYGGDFWSSVMENGLTQLSDEVEIEIDIHARRADYPARFADADSLDFGKQILITFRNEGPEAGLVMIDELNSRGELTAGKLSTIGYTLNAWERYEEALAVFGRRLRYFPDLNSTHSQLGITELLLGRDSLATAHFQNAWQADSTDTRAFSYLRLLGTTKQ